MDIKEQKSTYSSFMKYSIRSLAAAVIVLALLGLFVA
ncbi:aa3-type cytochrome c oxidase subunit IV [Kordiimonas aquimaris]|nr:aa3-type cytochrome c oxidase subunit IV [Kordiimonas aquimaris]